MKTNSFSRLLTGFSALVLAATLAVWIGTGTHLGWTRTTAVLLQHDEVTGIEYPVHVPAFVAGVEVLAAGLLAAVVFAGGALFARRRAAVRA